MIRRAIRASGATFHAQLIDTSIHQAGLGRMPAVAPFADEPDPGIKLGVDEGMLLEIQMCETEVQSDCLQPDAVE